MDQFVNTTNEVLDLHSLTIMHVIIYALCPRPFLDSLINDPPEKMNKLRIRVARHMSIEESQSRIVSLPNSKGFTNSQPFKALRLGKYDTYTPLNVS